MLLATEGVWGTIYLPDETADFRSPETDAPLRGNRPHPRAGLEPGSQQRTTRHIDAALARRVVVPSLAHRPVVSCCRIGYAELRDPCVTYSCVPRRAMWRLRHSQQLGKHSTVHINSRKTIDRHEAAARAQDFFPPMPTLHLL